MKLRKAAHVRDEGYPYLSRKILPVAFLSHKARSMGGIYLQMTNSEDLWVSLRSAHRPADDGPLRGRCVAHRRGDVLATGHCVGYYRGSVDRHIDQARARDEAATAARTTQPIAQSPAKTRQPCHRLGARASQPITASPSTTRPASAGLVLRGSD